MSAQSAEKIKRYESYEKFFSNELNSQRPLVPDFRSEYNYIGGKRPSDKGYYYADKKARRQMEKKSKIESKNGRIIILFIPSVGVFLPLKVQVLT